MNRLARSVLGAGALAGPLLCTYPARAEANNKIAAEALFDEGRRLMAQNKAEQACPMFADSQRLDPTPGTLLNLANCYEKVGRTASAWATYREAESLAAATSRPDLGATARKHAEALVLKLARITISAPSGKDVDIKRDGVPVGAAERGVPIPADPGRHVIDASAPGRKPFSATVQLAEGAALTVNVPPLEDAPEETKPALKEPVVTAAPSPAPATTQPASDEPSGLGAQRIIALAVGGVGVIGLGVGTALALSAKSQYDDSLASCPRDQNLCTAEGVAKRDDARQTGNIATVAFAVGGVALATGAALWFLAPSRSEKTVAWTGLRVMPTFGGTAVSGRW